ncbi:hypothetical protein [Xanthovirga aplysinae]|uniref:hypothetical protein n=1 Tax=Xanthovirga aplysinae TaxID=2529853 RepID=UPI0012BC2DA2|nr:hypothetical protein [Xanthovirga aplysinae]MTI32555.1 hypothetical protein [Xanthovirga aplysinae]
MLKIVLHFYKDLQKFNLPFSLFVGFLGVMASNETSIIDNYFTAFSLSLLSGGFALSLFFYELRFKENYYFYLNRGLSRFELYISVFGLNGLLVLFLLGIKNLAL